MSTAWIKLTVTDLDDYLVAAQMTALKTAALKSGQDDPVAEILGDIVRSVRLAIASCPSNVLSATADSIPPELKRHACALAIEAAQPRLKLALSEDQRRAADNARAALKMIADCKLKVSDPTDPETTPSAQSSSAIQSTQPRTKQAGRANLTGL